jgi:hypothetical protein
MRAIVARFAPVVFAALFSTAFVQDAAAQWPDPDKLDGGPCCTTTTPNAPRVPNFTQTSLQICWLDCNVDAINTCEAVWSSPTPVDNCRNYAKRLRLRTTAGVVKWNARIKFRYSRTWIETDPSGVQFQVWRYLANGDLRPTTAAGAAPCPVPPCTAPNGNKVRYTGYVDYALDCTGTLREFSWMLTHACDRFDHVPGFPRGGIFHPGRTYTFVGPAAGFVASPFQPLEAGGGTLEAVRRIDRVAGSVVDTCQFEEQIQHGLSPITQFCACGPVAAPPQYAFCDLSIGGFCGSTLTSTGSTLLPGYVTAGLGSWSDPFTFPGVEALRWTAGGYLYGDPCTGIVRDEAFFGVATHGGWIPNQLTSAGIGPTLPNIFVDQGNSLQGSFGSVLNRPYRSDHILNLNY